jgi:parvulin-like peptidyl-prolyl isomerase
MDRLRRDPGRFAETAKAESDDPQSRGRGGDLGSLGRGSLEPELDAAAFSAVAPALLGPIRTASGLHLLQVRSLTRLSFAEAAAHLRADLRRAREQALQAALLERLAKAHPVHFTQDQP